MLQATTLAERLALLRDEHELTQKEVAARLSVSPQAYSQYENGKRQPSMDTLITLSDLYSVDLTYLLTGEKIIPAGTSGDPLAETIACYGLPKSAYDELKSMLQYLQYKYKK